MSLLPRGAPRGRHPHLPYTARRSVEGSSEAGNPPGSSAGLPHLPTEGALKGLGEGVIPLHPFSLDSKVKTGKWGLAAQTSDPSLLYLGSPSSLGPASPPEPRSRPLHLGRPTRHPPSRFWPSFPPAPSPLTQHDGAEPPGQALGQVIHVELHRIEIRRLHWDPWRLWPQSPFGTRQRLGSSGTRRGRGEGRGETEPGLGLRGGEEDALPCSRPSARHRQRLL